MSVNNGRITAPISHKDPYVALGVRPLRNVGYDDGYICHNGHGKTNRFSKHKPIIYPTEKDLTDTQFVGHPSQTNNGIYYGLKMGTVWGRLADIHDATFEYTPPAGGDAQPYRWGDFDGYDHNARITPLASIVTSVINYGSVQAFGCQIVHDLNNTTGVSLDDIFTFMRQSGKDIFSLANAYPCVIMTRQGGTTHAVRALKCSDTNAVTPLYYNGAWRQHYYFGLERGTLGDAAQILPTTNGTYPMTISVFLAGALTGTGFDLHDWCLTTDGNPAWGLPQAVGLYDACGKAITYKVFDDSPSGGNPSTWRVYVAGFVSTSTGIRFYVSSNLNDPKATYTMRVTVVGYYTNEKSFTIAQNKQINVDFTYNDLHMGPPNPPAGSVFTMSIEIYEGAISYSNMVYKAENQILTIQ